MHILGFDLSDEEQECVLRLADGKGSPASSTLVSLFRAYNIRLVRGLHGYTARGDLLLTAARQIREKRMLSQTAVS